MLYTTEVATVFGTFTLSADSKGLTAIVLPQKAATPPVQKTPDKRNTETCLPRATKQIQEYCAGKRTVFDLPLSLHGTAFQQQVWKIIGEIPYGRTRSYGDIARQLGSTGKARAVGGAAHANPLPLVIPCHRVIGSSGSLTGFAGGLDLKKCLLDLETEQLSNLSDR